MSTPTRPLVSLCLIVKDEEDNLERCLASVRDVVDELVVYDTGSTDGTVALAERLGATVVRGEWHDDFGRARNEALAHCHGEWILHLDADEQLDGGDGLRRRLQDRQVDAFSIEIVNIGARVGDYSHRNIRLFRRSRGEWTGRLHERVHSVDGRPLRTVDLTGWRILHHGYAAEVVGDRDKIARNLRIAHAELAQAGPGDDVGRLLVNVARAYISAGDIEFAIGHLRRAADVDGSAAHAAALQLGALLMVDTGRLEDAARWTDELEAAAGSGHDVISYLRGSIDLFAGREAPGLLGLAGADRVVGIDGSDIPDAELRRRCAAALLHADRHEDAAAKLIEIVATDPGEEVWGALARTCHEGGLGFDAVCAQLPKADLRSVLAQVLTQPVAVAEAFGCALRAHLPGDPRLVAFAVHHARHLDDLEPMVAWSTLIRGAGLAESCPIVERAADPTVPAPERFMAAVVAHAAFRDQRALELLDTITPLLAPADEPAAIHVLEELAPELLIAN